MKYLVRFLGELDAPIYLVRETVVAMWGSSMEVQKDGKSATIPATIVITFGGAQLWVQGDVKWVATKLRMKIPTEEK